MKNNKTPLTSGLLSPNWPPSASCNGIVSYADRLARGMRALGHRPFIMSSRVLENDGTPDVVSVEPKGGLWCRAVNGLCYRLGCRRLPYSPRIMGMRDAVCRLHGDEGLQIFHVEETWGIGRLLIGRIPVPLIVSLHGPWFLNGSANGESKDKNYHDRIQLEGLGIDAADAVSAPSQAVLDSTREFYDLALPNAQVIPNPIEAVEEEYRWQHGTCNSRTILFVGRFDRHKGGDVVIEAFAKLAKSEGRVRLLFCGPDRGFKDEAGRRRSLPEFIESRIDSPEIRARINFLGQQPSDRIQVLRKEAAVTIMASRWENFANVLLEAVAVGCPVVATATGGTAEIIHDGETGLLVPPEDPTALADAICRFLEDRELAARLGEAAWRDARERFDPVKIAGQTVEFYRQVIDGWERRSA